jgi:hypothetical protein
MNTTAGAGLRATVRRFCRQTQNHPFDLKVVFQDKTCIQPLKDLLTHIGARPTAVDLINATGAEALWIIPSNELDSIMTNSFVPAGLAQQHTEIGMKEGEPMLLFNPDKYSQVLYDKMRSQLVEHELWNLFIKRAFPSFAGDLSDLLKETSKPAPDFVHDLLNPLFLFAVRVAAMQARCRDFARADSETGLVFEARSVMERSTRFLTNGRLASAVFSGLLFSHVFGFELFPPLRSFARQNRRTIRDLANQISGLQFTEVEELARNMLGEMRLPGRSPDISLAGCRSLIKQFWSGAWHPGGKS